MPAAEVGVSKIDVMSPGQWPENVRPFVGGADYNKIAAIVRMGNIARVEPAPGVSILSLRRRVYVRMRQRGLRVQIRNLEGKTALLVRLPPVEGAPTPSEEIA